MKHESGQASIVAILTLPLVLFTVGALLLIAYALSIEAKATLACRTEVAKSQAEVARAAQKLMSLNTEAISLENERQSAKRVLAAARALPNPAAKVAALAALAVIERAQIPIMRQQRYWLAKGRHASYSLPVQARTAVTKSLPNEVRNLASGGSLKSLIPKFEMRATPSGARTPAYFPANNFVETQNGGIKWISKTTLQRSTESSGADSNNAMNWLIELQTFFPSLQIGCSMTLVPTPDGGWSPQPTEDKLSSSS